MDGRVTIREAMTREFVGVSEGDDVTAAAGVLLEEEVPAAVVLRGQEPVGLLTRGDVLTAVVADADIESATAGDVMTESVPTVSPDQTVAEAAELSFTHSSGTLVVEGRDDGRPLGVLTHADIVATTTLSTGADETTATRAAATASAQETSRNGTDEGGFSDQGICERCESLAEGLASVNGQLLCADCRDV